MKVFVDEVLEAMGVTLEGDVIVINYPNVEVKLTTDRIPDLYYSVRKDRFYIPVNNTNKEEVVKEIKSKIENIKNTIKEINEAAKIANQQIELLKYNQESIVE